MTEATKEKECVSLLQTVYKNIRSQTELILDLMPKVKGEALKSEMTVTLSAYEAFASRAAKRLCEAGEKPIEGGMLEMLAGKWSAAKDTLLDKSEANIAHLLAEGAHKAATELKTALREAENTKIPEEDLKLLRDLCVFEEKNAKKFEIDFS